jgi:hypothetical protein
MHSFTAQEFTDAAAQDSKAIGESAVRGLSSALELQLPPLTPRVENLSEGYRPPIAQLASP